MAGVKKPEDKKPEVPGWIVSFSDMTTLLLAFFVLLQTFAKTQDPELFYAGQGSFRRAISGMGISKWLGGQTAKPLVDYRKLQYPTAPKEDEDGRERIMDLDDEKIRQAFRGLRESMEMKASDVASETIHVQNTPVTFQVGKDDLGEKAMGFLSQLARDLKQTADRESVKLYVIGLAADVKTRKEQMVLSARRAAAVQRYLSAALSGESSDKWDVYSWGAGDGGRWCQTYGLMPKGVAGGTDCIAVAVMSAGAKGGRR